MRELERYILLYINEHNLDYKQDSLYICDDELTFMYKDSEDKLHTGVIDINTSKIKYIR